ncbi:MAG: fused MFS/spermidine synthase [Anaerolineaceae bacterium]|nr:fused MFS/spermidine synthase [Anaerolineaceae bacterium]
MRKIIYISVFISGMVTLAVEMTASRLLGSVFGTSNLVWSSIIGLILIYLAVGYFLGGYWVDKKPDKRTFFNILIWASISICTIPLLSRPVLRLAANGFDQLQMGVLFGSFFAVLVLFIVPIILLGTISPFAIRLAIQEKETSGKISGNIYAISTLGSFVGTFLPVLFLIPLFGTYRTFIFFGGVLLLSALICKAAACGIKSILYFLWAPILIIVLWFWGLPGTDKTSANQIFETESSYNYIQVLDDNEFQLLRLNEGQGIHSIYHPEINNYYGPWEQVSVSPFFNPAPYDMEEIERIAIIGLAAGTASKFATMVYGPVQIDGFEIDPKIVEVAREYFDMNEENLNIHIDDGRWGLDKSPYKYSIINIDAYRPPYIPFHMTTQEFFKIAYDHLTDDGVVVINVGRSPNDRRLINSLSSTLLTIFPSVHVMDIPNTFNSMIFATRQKTNATNLIENYVYLDSLGNIHPELLATMQLTIANLKPAPEPAKVFTDDLAPIEWITNTMVLDFIMNGNMETIQ